jgi:hypothetical protein
MRDAMLSVADLQPQSPTAANRKSSGPAASTSRSKCEFFIDGEAGTRKTTVASNNPASTSDAAALILRLRRLCAEFGKWMSIAIDLPTYKISQE